MTQSFDWLAWAGEACEAVRASGRWRAPRSFDAAGPSGDLQLAGEDEARSVISFASNDYLGLTHHPNVVAAAHEALDRWGAGAGSARLVVGSRPPHHELERELADWKRAEAAVLFPTGFATNLGVLTTFGAAGVRIYSDELNHASIVDGSRLARADVSIFGHRDLDHLAALLEEHAEQPAIVVSDTVFSMDGDIADLDGLVALCREHGALLVLDEAHAVLGPEPDLDGVIALCIGTLSKTLGSLGGFVAGPTPLCELLVNRARSYIFTTASTPADTAAALAAVRVLRSSEGEERRQHLRSLIEILAPGHPSPIVPVLVGDEGAAVAAATALLDQGLLVPAIRPPTVPPGTSRLRIALSADHTHDQVRLLVDALGAAGLAPGATEGATANARPSIEGASIEAGRSRPEVLVLVVGTGTEVGKTWVSVQVLERLRASGLAVEARKPAQSFEPGDELSGATDAQLLAAATNTAAEVVCPPHRWYEVPMAPPMAADVLGRSPVLLADLIGEIGWSPDTQVGVVETAGGVRSPQAVDGNALDLATALAPELVVLVADARLGAIHAVRTSAAGLEGAQILVHLNRYDASSDLHRRNRAWIEGADHFDVTVEVEELVARIAALVRAKVSTPR